MRLVAMQGPLVLGDAGDGFAAERPPFSAGSGVVAGVWQVDVLSRHTPPELQARQLCQLFVCHSKCDQICVSATALQPLFCRHIALQALLMGVHHAMSAHPGTLAIVALIILSIVSARYAGFEYAADGRAASSQFRWNAGKLIVCFYRWRLPATPSWASACR